jgi:hypothetical protein
VQLDRLPVIAMHLRAFRLLAIGVLLCAPRAIATAQARTDSDAAERTLSAAQAQADFDQLRAALEEAHGALYRHTAKPDLARTFDALRTRLNAPVTQRTLIAVIAEMIAAVGDGHAHLELDKTTSDALSRAALFPLQVALEGERLVVVRNYSATDTTIRPGMLLVAVDGHSTNDILRRIMPALPADGVIETGKRARIASSFGEQYWLFVSPSAEFTVTARDASGRVVTTRLAGIPRKERAAERNPVNARVLAGESALRRPDEVVALRWLDDKIAHLRIRWFDGDDFTRAIDSVFAAMREKDTRALILDLRGNPGGVDELGAMLVSRLVTAPFRYFDRIHLASVRPSFNTWLPGTSERLAAGVLPDPAGGYLVTPALHPGVAEQQPARTPFRGRVVVLIDGGTFSTAADVAAVLRHLNRATFVGEETGGGYEGNTSGLNALVTLTHSRLGLKIPMYGYWNAVSAPTQRSRGTIPDRPVPGIVDDLMRGVDTPMQAALELARAP